MSEQPPPDSIQAAYAKLYEPYKQKADGRKFRSLYDGYEETHKPASVSAKPEARGSGVPFTVLLDRAYPGLEVAEQIKLWNDLLDEFWTVDQVLIRCLSQEVASAKFATWRLAQDCSNHLIEMDKGYKVLEEIERQKVLGIKALSLRGFIKSNWPDELRRSPKDCNKKIQHILGTDYVLPKKGDLMITNEQSEQLKTGWKSINGGSAARQSIQAGHDMKANSVKSPQNKPDCAPVSKKSR